jgi:hypothetical protein
MLLDDLRQHLAVWGQRGDGRLVVAFHEAAVALHIGAEDGGGLTLCAFRTHRVAS